MTERRLGEALAAAVADNRALDSDVLGLTRGNGSDLVDTFRVISAMGAARQGRLLAEQQRAARVLGLAVTAIGTLAAGKLVLAGLGALTGLSRVVPARLDWPYGLNIILFGVTGALLVLGGGRDRRLRALGLLFLIIGSAFAGPLLPLAASFGSSAMRAVVTLGGYAYADAFLPFALWVFVWRFPSVPRQPWARRTGTTFLIGTAVVGVALFAANLIAGVGLAAGSLRATGLLRVLDRTDSMLVYWPLLALVGLPAFPYLVWKSRVETRANQRRVRFFVGALLLGLLPMLLAILLTPVVPVLQDPAWRGLIGLGLYAALAAIVPATVYAVTVDHVMELHLVVHKTIQYALARSSVWCAAVGPLLVLAVDLYRHRDLRVGDYIDGGRHVSLLALSIVGFGVLTFRHQIQRLVDRWFLRETADFTEAMARLEQGLRSARTIREISQVLKREIEHALHPATVAVLMVDERAERFVSLDGSVSPLRDGSTLLQLLRSIRTEVQLSYRADGPVAGLLPPSERAWLAETGFRLFVPLLGSTGTLLGTAGIGAGRNGLAYTERDCMLMTAMCGQVALKLENSRLRQQPHGASSDAPVESVALDWQNEPAVRCPECAAMWPPTVAHCSCGTPTLEAALPLVVKGKFRVEQFIGSGGTGVVYRAVDMTLDRKVAIKTLPAIRLRHASRLHREARAMATLLHPNLALIYGAEHWKGTPLLIFEYLEGGTLLDSLRRGPVELDEVIDLGTLLADALDRVHSSGVLHRDIKPSNIGYTADGVPKLLDFGLAAILDRSKGVDAAPAVLPRDPGLIAELAWGAHPASSLTITQQLVGTPLYLSPEALAGEAPQPSFDLWSLSLVLYEAYVGRHPLAGETIAALVERLQRGAIPDVRDFRPDCPAAFAAFLNDALSPVLERRAASAGELRNRLRLLRPLLFPQAS